MPIVNLNRYTDPITGNVEYGTELPPGWFIIEGEVFSPAAQVPLAQYVVDHPTVGFAELVASLTARPAAAAEAIRSLQPLPDLQSDDVHSVTATSNFSTTDSAQPQDQPEDPSTQ